MAQAVTYRKLVRDIYALCLGGGHHSFPAHSWVSHTRSLWLQATLWVNRFRHGQCILASARCSVIVLLIVDLSR